MTTAEFVRGLQAIAAFYAANPDLNLPALQVYSHDGLHDATKIVKAFGKCEKTYSDNFLHITKRFHNVPLTFVLTKAAVCNPKVVGTKHIPEKFVPEHTIPAQDIEIVEWDCHPLLGNK